MNVNIINMNTTSTCIMNINVIIMEHLVLLLLSMESDFCFWLPRGRFSGQVSLAKKL